MPTASYAQKCLFLDRDGVINKEYDYVHKIENFEFIDGVFEACAKANQLGYEIIIITNQAGIARGFYGEEEFSQLTQWMLEQFSKNGVKITAVYHCPHHPKFSGDCSCRKPKPGMILLAKQEHNIDLNASILVGDKESDMEAGFNAGLKTLIKVKSGHPLTGKETKAHFVLDSIKDIEGQL